MFDKINETALTVLNAIIWRLYMAQEHRAAMIIESERDKTAMREYDKNSKAKQDREICYMTAAKIYKSALRFERADPLVVQDLKKLTTLARVYFLMVKNSKALVMITKSADLYNRVTFLYLKTFTSYSEDQKIGRDQMSEYRGYFATIERSIRHIKADHPELFSFTLVTKTARADLAGIDSEGNSAIL